MHNLSLNLVQNFFPHIQKSCMKLSSSYLHRQTAKSPRKQQEFLSASSTICEISDEKKISDFFLRQIWKKGLVLPCISFPVVRLAATVPQFFPDFIHPFHVT